MTYIYAFERIMHTWFPAFIYFKIMYIPNDYFPEYHKSYCKFNPLNNENLIAICTAVSIFVLSYYMYNDQKPAYYFQS